MELSNENKNKVIKVLTRLCKMYETMPKKTFQLKAIMNATKNIITFNDNTIILTCGKDYGKNIKGIGKGTIKRIDEIIKTGDLKELEGFGYEEKTELLKRANTGEKALIYITGVGPVKAKKLKDDGYNTIDDVREGMNKDLIKLTHHQKIGVKYYEDFLERIPRDEINKISELLNACCASTAKSFKINSDKFIVEICGSYRRGKKDCGDIDVLITDVSNDIDNAKYFSKYVANLISCGFIVDSLTTKIKTKYMGVCKLGKFARRIDMRIVPYSCFYPALIYFTGSKDFNIKIRKLAIEKGYSLSEYGIKKKDSEDIITFNSEKDIFNFLEFDYVEPNER